jgi:hypothetical protein
MDVAITSAERRAAGRRCQRSISKRKIWIDTAPPGSPLAGQSATTVRRWTPGTWALASKGHQRPAFLPVLDEEAQCRARRPGIP